MLEWTPEDQAILEAMQLARLQYALKGILQHCTLDLRSDNTLEVHASSPGEVDILLHELRRLGAATWICLGATSLEIWFMQERIFECPTIAGVSVKPCDIQSKKRTALGTAMTPATLEQKKSSRKAQKRTPAPAIAQFRSVQAVGQFLGISPDEVERRAISRGISLIEDEQGSRFIPLRDAVELAGPSQVEDNPAEFDELPTPAAPEMALTPERAAEMAGTLESKESSSNGNGNGSKKAKKTLPEGFVADANKPAPTLRRALEALANSPGRQNQIAKSISDGSDTGRAYLKMILDRLPEGADREKFSGQIRAAANRLVNPKPSKSAV